MHSLFSRRLGVLFFLVICSLLLVNSTLAILDDFSVNVVSDSLSEVSNSVEEVVEESDGDLGGYSGIVDGVIDRSKKIPDLVDADDELRREAAAKRGAVQDRVDKQQKDAAANRDTRGKKLGFFLSALPKPLRGDEALVAVSSQVNVSNHSLNQKNIVDHIESSVADRQNGYVETGFMKITRGSFSKGELFFTSQSSVSLASGEEIVNGSGTLYFEEVTYQITITQVAADEITFEVYRDGEEAGSLSLTRVIDGFWDGKLIFGYEEHSFVVKTTTVRLKQRSFLPAPVVSQSFLVKYLKTVFRW